MDRRTYFASRNCWPNCQNCLLDGVLNCLYFRLRFFLMLTIEGRGTSNRNGIWRYLTALAKKYRYILGVFNSLSSSTFAGFHNPQTIYKFLSSNPVYKCKFPPIELREKGLLNQVWASLPGLFLYYYDFKRMSINSLDFLNNNRFDFYQDLEPQFSSIIYKNAFKGISKINNIININNNALTTSKAIPMSHWPLKLNKP